PATRETYGDCVDVAGGCCVDAGAPLGAFFLASITIAPSRRMPMAAPIRKLRPFLGRLARTATDRVGGGSGVADSASGGSASGPGVGSSTDASDSGPGVWSIGSGGGRSDDAGVGTRIGVPRRWAGATGAISRLVLRASSAST